jgi:hypothetical protein
MVLVYAGNSPLETARSLDAKAQTPASVLENGKPASAGKIP